MNTGYEVARNRKKCRWCEYSYDFMFEHNYDFGVRLVRHIVECHLKQSEPILSNFCDNCTMKD